MMLTVLNKASTYGFKIIEDTIKRKIVSGKCNTTHITPIKSILLNFFSVLLDLFKVFSKQYCTLTMLVVTVFL